MLLATTFVAEATDLPEALAQAREALVAGDPAAAQTALKDGEDAAARSPRPLPPEPLGRLFYYRGLAAALAVGELEPAMDHWRSALLVAPTLSWESELQEERAWHATFEALRREVASREAQPVAAPERRGAARLYIDGLPIDEHDGLRAGQHLAQITCDDGTTRGTWFEAGRRVAWFRLCPGGVDRDAVAASAPADEWGEVGPAFGAPPAPPAPGDPPAAKASSGRLGPALLVSGSALLLGSLAINLSTATPPWSGAGTTAAAAPRGATMVTGAAGLALLAGGLVVPFNTTGATAAPSLQLGWTWRR